MQQNLRSLSYRHRQIARLLVGGNSMADIARLLKINKSTVSRVVRDPLVAAEISRLQNHADASAVACVPGIPEKIAEGALRGVEVLLDVLEDPRTDPEMLRLKANTATELLSRAGYGPVKQVKLEQASVSAHYLTAEDIENIKRRAREAGFLELPKQTDGEHGK